MSKTQIYVIQRNDGYFYYANDGDFYYDNELDKIKFKSKPKFTKDIKKCFHILEFGTKHWAETEIRNMRLQNCKPVKVKIEIVGEDDE